MPVKVWQKTKNYYIDHIPDIQDLSDSRALYTVFRRILNCIAGIQGGYLLKSLYTCISNST